MLGGLRLFLSSYELKYNFFDGILLICFKDIISNDITNLSINTSPIVILGHDLYNCVVSWGSNGSYNIVVEFDKELLLNDESYCYYFMSRLLNKSRVIEYLKRGLSSNPDFECGIYIGGVFYNESGLLEKRFYDDIGSKFHNEDYMVHWRKALKK